MRSHVAENVLHDPRWEQETRELYTGDYGGRRARRGHGAGSSDAATATADPTAAATDRAAARRPAGGRGGS